MSGKTSFVCLLLTTYLLPLTVSAQRGKDGTGVVTAAGTIVNEYTYLTADAAAGATSLTVSSSSLNVNTRFSGPLAAGDLLMIIQVQGATIDGVPDNVTWGAVTAYNNCGLYEFAEVMGVPGATTIDLTCGLANSYTAAGNVVVVRVPRYSGLSVNAGGELTAEAWNGQTGGILAVEAEGDVTVAAGGELDVSALGFRGGVLESSTSVGQYLARSTNPADGGEKGESIAGYQSVYDNLYNGRYGRGAPANGGGGGNAHNAGGGGGANGGDFAGWFGLGDPDNSVPAWNTAWDLEFAGLAGAVSPGGGKGGYTWANTNNDATVVGPGDPSWTGDHRKAVGGFGGRPLDYSTGRLFLGGGGGAGDNNGPGAGNQGGPGGRGGGIVYIMAYGNVSGSGLVIADGQDGGDACCADNTSKGNDGSGGAGGGGAIVLNAVGTISGISARANGGEGGSQFNSPSFGSVNESEGPGGGGGGGHIAVSGGAITRAANGGPNGTTNSDALTEFPPNGATAGSPGNAGATVTNFYITAAKDTDTICSGMGATLTVILNGTVPGGTTVNWYDAQVGGNWLGTGNPLSIGVFTSDTVFYAGTCPGTYRIPFYIMVSTPGVFDAGPDASICTGSSTQLSGSGGVTYSWSPAGSLDNAGIPNPVASPTANTTYYVTITDAAGCSGTDSVMVSVGATLSVTLTPDTALCSGDSIQLSVSGGGNKFTWTPAGSLSSSTVANPWAKPAVTTRYYVTVEDTAGGCSVLDSVDVTVSGLPAADAGPDTSFCAGDSLQLGASGGTAYQWSPAATLSSATAPDPYASPTSTTKYFVTVTNAGGCSAVDSVTVTVNPKPTAGAGNNVTICPGSSTQLSGSGGGSYQWTPAATLDNATIANPVATPTATTIYRLAVTGAGGCSDSDSVVVTIGSSLSVSITKDTAVCAGGSAQLNAGGGSTYSWTPAATLSNGAIPNPVAIPTATTTYIVTILDTAGCQGTDSVTVTVNPPPNADAGGDTTICTDASVQLNASGGTSYIWSPAGSLDNAGVSNPVASPTIATTYYVTVTDGNGCPAADSVRVDVSPPPTVNFSSLSTCLGDSTYFTDLSSGTGGIVSWSWDLGDGTGTSVVQNPAYLYAGTGTYTVRLTVTDGLGCTDSVAGTVTIGNRPVVNFNDTASGCGSVTVTFNNFSNGGATYSWDFGDGNTSSAFGPTHTYGTPGSYSVKLVVTAASGCSDSLVFVNMINVYPQPVADFSASPQQTGPGTPVQFTDLSAGGTPCLWDFGDGSTSAAANPMHTYTDTGCYTVLLRVCTVNGCTDTATGLICVAQDKTLDIPNTITPNGDGANDKWIITNIDQYPGHVIEIYNRNGNLLRTLTAYKNDWDGTVDGKELPSAPYYFVLDLGDGSEEMKGVLTIIR